MLRHSDKISEQYDSKGLSRYSLKVTSIAEHHRGLEAREATVEQS